MYPPRSSSPDPYRARTPQLIDFFARAEAAQTELAGSNTQLEPFAPSSAHAGPSGTIPLSSAEFVAAEAPQVTVTTILEYLRENSSREYRFLMHETIRLRLQSGRLDPATFLTALKTVHTANHPTLTRLGVNAREQEAIKHRLIGILTNSALFRPPMRNACIAAHNDPEQLIGNLLEYQRSLHSN